MWKLVSAAGPAPAPEPYRLLVGTEYVVGRKNCAILIQDDQSISRSHAVLTVTHPETNLSQALSVPELIIQDTSKYGTFVNGEKVLNGTSRTLKSGDRVNFGVFESKFRVEYEPLIVCSSCLEVSGKTALNQAILQLGGLVVNDWSEECTHLVMISVKVTVKTICALICNRPIIKPEYFVECIRAIQSKQQLPKLESFYPPVDEPAIGPEKLDLSMRHERKIIFRGKTFLFLSAKQHKKLSPAIILGGGEAKLLPERIKETSLLLAPEVCVIDAGLTNSQVPTSDSARNWIDSIITVLQSKNLRAIPEAEIGLAVIFMSLERYCNPQNQPGIPKQPVSPGSAILHPTLSQSSTVDESMMLVTTSDRAYVADTEPEEPCMEISGEKTEKTPKMDRRDKMYSQNITSVKETPSTSGSVNTGTVLPRMHRTLVVDQKSQPLSPSKILGVNRNRERASQQESNSIKHYFQAAPKKRERIEEGETSVPKLAKMEEKSSHLSSQTQPTTSLMWKSKVEQTQKEQFTLDLKTNLLPVDTSLKLAIESSKSEKDKTVTKNVSSEKPASKKRKELGDLVEDAATLELVFGSKELDWEAEMGDCGEEHGTNMQKKRRLETKGKRIEEENVIQEEANRILQENELGTVPTSKKKIEIKQESSVLNTDGLQDVSSNLPSRLLLTEFRSLVVSHPRPNSLVAAQINYKQLSNFKKFKKVPYPGAGQLPHIIGGSDLIGHHAKKNSQLEEWLRQEMEEQNRHAREESLADDLFRYDPNVKRRR
ncbi:nibrin isoform X2 [Malaclemys terrapin pileata]|uniref:nibrin isoform X2 n=1 Tax=Malaclemys terrapin pileata TaxID=2991368 RepID=UPI0023A8C7B5|nr:nibrin isoform X2 [Malaclemys terrapin pileata]